MKNKQLIDNFGRSHDYLRISLLERCNLRCTYCMPEEGIPLRDKQLFMSQEELFDIVDTFVSLGVNKIRLTGGEPLIKKNFAQILAHLATLNVNLAITTNGILLDKYWNELKDSGLDTLNISLDTLIEERFNAITRRSYFERVLNNIEEAIARGFDVKVNVVLIKGTNEDEILDFIEFTKNRNVSVRFIEFMPFDGNQWDWSKTVSFKYIIDTVSEKYGSALQKLEDGENATARNYKIKDFKGSFGIISSVTNPFCDSCNRLRLTADGKIKNCLFSSEEIDLLNAHRNGQNLEDLILKSVKSKHAERAGLKSFDADDFSSENRSMVSIGG
ncbi:GTP 3',8-cyclase MoaA [Paracrocinitomix mangrovi]|uniref:GTP 3',8-cyclase MoaA n=1 Tax=Paracrocinitomix mangrovi TaxID=2862509 RepID=UPI001EDB514D|nr:GTP 3',8-cyclase MoaA [Paracrocinitomix mangrovi]UKN03199.1 GTP 3',8-cyclase MoaA [Paracrocinitomix mangrovi]